MSEPERRPTNSLRAQTRRQQQRMQRVRVLLLGAAGVLLVLFGGWWWASGAPSREKRDIAVTIPRGTRSPAIGRLLEQNGVIRSPYAFLLMTRLDGAAGELKAGRYALSSDMSLGQVIAALKQGPNAAPDGLRVTIPEGYTLAQITQALTDKGITDGAEAQRLATDRTTIVGMRAGFALPTTTLEGYLFPDTYVFKPNTPPVKLLEEMLQNFDARFARPHLSEIQTSGHTLHELVTIASLIEREAEAPEDRARIAGVIENRLKRHKRLEIDATVLYALGHHKSRVLYKDLNVKSPYNTYRHTGLPPGPIANPGLPCLMAALNPEQHDFLYYVARPNGTHIFSKTAKEHAAAIRQARAERKQLAAPAEPGRSDP